MLHKVCLVTGCGRGIGTAIARRMHARSYALIPMSPSASCKTLAAELGGIARVEEQAKTEAFLLTRTQAKSPARPWWSTAA